METQGGRRGALGTAVLTGVLMAVSRRCLLSIPGTERAITAGDCCRDGGFAPIHPKGAESGGHAVPEPVRTQLADAYRYAFSAVAGGVFTCSAYMPPLCDARLVRVKENKSNGFIASLSTQRLS